MVKIKREYLYSPEASAVLDALSTVATRDAQGNWVFKHMVPYEDAAMAATTILQHLYIFENPDEVKSAIFKLVKIQADRLFRSGKLGSVKYVFSTSIVEFVDAVRTGLYALVIVPLVTARREALINSIINMLSTNLSIKIRRYDPQLKSYVVVKFPLFKFVVDEDTNTMYILVLRGHLPLVLNILQAHGYEISHHPYAPELLKLADRFTISREISVNILSQHLEGNYELRDYQVAAVENAVKWLSYSGRATVEVPTGGGKTFIGSVVAYLFLKYMPNSAVIITTIRKDLVEQFAYALGNITGLNVRVVHGERDYTIAHGEYRVISATSATLYYSLVYLGYIFERAKEVLANGGTINDVLKELDEKPHREILSYMRPRIRRRILDAIYELAYSYMPERVTYKELLSGSVSQQTVASLVRSIRSAGALRAMLRTIFKLYAIQLETALYRALAHRDTRTAEDIRTHVKVVFGTSITHKPRKALMQVLRRIYSEISQTITDDLYKNTSELIQKVQYLLERYRVPDKIVRHAVEIRSGVDRLLPKDVVAYIAKDELYEGEEDLPIEVELTQEHMVSIAAKKLAKDLFHLMRNVDNVLVVIDEAHHTPAFTFLTLLAYLPNAFTLGLSATPYRGDKLDNIIYGMAGSIVYKISSSELIRQGFLVPAIIHSVEYDMCAYNHQLYTLYSDVSTFFQDLRREASRLVKGATEEDLMQVADAIVAEFGLAELNKELARYTDVLMAKLSELNVVPSRLTVDKYLLLLKKLGMPLVRRGRSLTFSEDMLRDFKYDEYKVGEDAAFCERYAYVDGEYRCVAPTLIVRPERIARLLSYLHLTRMLLALGEYGTARKMLRGFNISLMQVERLTKMELAFRDRARLDVIAVTASWLAQHGIKPVVIMSSWRTVAEYIYINTLRYYAKILLDRKAVQDEYEARRAAYEKVAFVHGEVPSEERWRIYEAARNRELDILIGTTLIDEGLDIPSISALIIAYAPKSVVGTKQRIGRGLRPYSDKHALIVIDIDDVRVSELHKSHSCRLFVYCIDEPGWVKIRVPALLYSFVHGRLAFVWPAKVALDVYNALPDDVWKITQLYKESEYLEILSYYYRATSRCVDLYEETKDVRLLRACLNAVSKYYEDCVVDEAWRGYLSGKCGISKYGRLATVLARVMAGKFYGSRCPPSDEPVPVRTGMFDLMNPIDARSYEDDRYFMVCSTAIMSKINQLLQESGSICGVKSSPMEGDPFVVPLDKHLIQQLLRPFLEKRSCTISEIRDIC